MRLAGLLAFHTLNKPDDAVGKLIASRIAENEQAASEYTSFKEYPMWCADAQVALMSMFWALGVGGTLKFTHFCSAVGQGYFRLAANECAIADQRGTIPKRNKMNNQLLRNAQVIADKKLDPDVLYYPRDLEAEAYGTTDDSNR